MILLFGTVETDITGGLISTFKRPFVNPSKKSFISPNLYSLRSKVKTKLFLFS